MSAAPFLLGAALLFWGWQTGSVAVAAALAMALEAARFVSWRLELEPRDFRRLWDLTCALFVGFAIYCYSVYEVSPAVLTFVQWTPAVFFPFMAAQAYSRHDRLALDTFLWPLRGRTFRGHSSRGLTARLSVAYPFLALCILASSTAYVRDHSFYGGLCALAGWSLWAERPRRGPGLLTAALFVLAAGLGQAGHRWMRDIQPLLERKSSEWFGLFRYHEFDYFEGATAIGRVGAMKLSGRIVLRLQPEAASAPPKLLRQVSYNQLRFVTWLSRGRSFQPMRSDHFADWPLLPSLAGDQSATVSFRLEGGRGLLALPPGATRLQGLAVGEVEKNPLGVVRVAQGPDAVSYRVRYGADQTIDSSPNRFDLSIPPEEEAAVSQIVAELGLGSRKPEQVEAALNAFFREHFRYTNHFRTVTAGARRPRLPVSDFLLHERAGHCEYFATATVLLLRRLGVPTRYATGYAVPANARRGNTYLIRERHGHAWALAWINGQWRDLDTTPPIWGAEEEKSASLFEPLRDWWSGLCFRWAAWRQRDNGGSWSRYLGWLVAPLLVFLGWRLARRATLSRRDRPNSGALAPSHWPGLDSEFYRVERRLVQQGLGPQAGETLARWLRRVRSDSFIVAGLEPLLALHYRYRFDPRGLDTEERTRLAADTQAWLEEGPEPSRPSH